jgi:hypothetical protein
MLPTKVLVWLGTVLLVPLVIVPTGDDYILAYRFLAWAAATLGLLLAQFRSLARGLAGWSGASPASWLLVA